MRKTVFILFGAAIVLTGAGCASMMPWSDQAALETDAAMPVCRYHKMIGTYSGDVATFAADAVLPDVRMIDPSATTDNLVVEFPAYLNFSTNPPTASTGTSTYSVIDDAGTVTMVDYAVDAAARVRWEASYLNAHPEMREKRCSVATRSERCASEYELVGGVVYKVIPSPC